MSSGITGGIDAIGVIERCYDLQLPESDWLRGVVQAIAPGFDHGVGMSGSLWRVPTGTNTVTDSVDVSTHPDLAALAPMIYALVGQAAPRFYTQVPYFGSAFTKWKDEPVLGVILSQCSAAIGTTLRDVVGLSVGDGAQSGVSLTSFSPRPVRHSRAFARCIHKIALHLGAGLRLRQRLRAGLVTSADAVFDTRGRALYANEAAKSADVRLALADAVRSIERARGKLRRSAPAEALELWQALVAGRWTVVDWVDSDDRRFVVVHSNPVGNGNPRSLSSREREVAGFLIHGRSDSEIAYALGVQKTTVKGLARNVLRKLGRARRSELASLFGGAGAESIQLLEGSEVLVLRSGAREASLWEQLSPAERAVVELALGGASNGEIAQKRGRSLRTVANQLAVVYARFGVRGRSELAALLGAPSDATSVNSE